MGLSAEAEGVSQAAENRDMQPYQGEWVQWKERGL